MKKQQLDVFRKKLLALQQRLGRHRAEHRQEAFQPTGGEASGGISNAPLHPSDLAGRQTEEYVSLGLIENEEQLIEEVNLALARMDQGTYSQCEACRKPIAMERLEAAPYARLCIDCAKKPAR
jgi:RNA polymerase-binding protein DksA